MRYRVTGDEKGLADAQRLFAVLADAKRPHADRPDDGPLFVDWLHVVDSHFAVAKTPWPVRGVYAGSKSTHPLLTCYRWKYYHWEPGKTEAARAKLPEDERPTDRSRIADLHAVRGVGAKTTADVAQALQEKSPKDAEAKARWLWAYWTARMEEKK